MTNRKADFQLGDVVIEAKSDMRDRLVANLRHQTRQSRENRQARQARGYAGQPAPHRSGAALTSVSIVEGEPQAVLIKNRNEHLAKDVWRLRSRYANILAEESSVVNNEKPL